MNLLYASHSIEHYNEIQVAHVMVKCNSVVEMLLLIRNRTRNMNINGKSYLLLNKIYVTLYCVLNNTRVKLWALKYVWFSWRTFIDCIGISHVCDCIDSIYFMNILIAKGMQCHFVLNYQQQRYSSWMFDIFTTTLQGIDY